MPQHSKLGEFGQHQVDLRMPTLSKMMTEGFVFENAITPSPLCAPARACLASGTNYKKCAVPNNLVNYPTDTISLYNILKKNDYQVLSTGKLDLHKGTKFWGCDGWVDELGEIGFTQAIDNEGKIDAIIGEINLEEGKPSGTIQSLISLETEYERGPYINYLYKKGVAKYHIEDMDKRNQDGRNISITKLSDEDYCDNWLTENGISLLNNVPKNQPWFLQVNFTGPHDPWDITEKMAQQIKGREFPLPIMADSNNLETDVIIRAHYTAMLENIDNNMKKILDYIEERGDLEDTIVIYASDHGEMLGEFGLFGKCIPNKGSIHIPMIIWGKDIPNGQSSCLVELQDLAATIIELTEGDEKVFEDSKTLMPIIRNEKEELRSVVISALDNWFCIKDKHFKLIEKKGEKPQLFNICEDPWETIDISHDNTEMIKELKIRYQQQ